MIFFLCTDEPKNVACDCAALTDKIFSFGEEIKQLKKTVKRLKTVTTGIYFILPNGIISLRISFRHEQNM